MENTGDLLNFFNFVLKNMNGLTESVLLIHIVLIDTILGNRWRFSKGMLRISSHALNGLLQHLAMSCIPLMFYLTKVALSKFDHSNLVLFDYLSTIVFIFFAYWFIISVIANVKLSGYKIPKILDPLISDELISKELRGIDKEMAKETIKDGKINE